MALSPSAKPLNSAPPPLHSVAVIIFFLTISVAYLPSLQEIDEIATIETFTTTILPSSPFALSPLGLGLVRLSFAVFIFGCTVTRIAGTGYETKTSYHPTSRLRSAPFRMRRLRILGPFTWWSWVLLGLSFLLSSTVSILAAYGREDLVPPWLPRLALVTFEISAPNALLVASIVKYALWPHALKSRGSAGSAVFRSFYGLVAHNVNVLFVLIEVCFLGGLPIASGHVAIAPLVGIAYVLFAWASAGTWAPQSGPQFLYFFLDTTLGWASTAALMGLLAVLLAFYTAFSSLGDHLEHLQGGWLTHLGCVLAISSLVCRFKD